MPTQCPLACASVQQCPQNADLDRMRRSKSGQSTLRQVRVSNARIDELSGAAAAVGAGLAGVAASWWNGTLPLSYLAVAFVAATGCSAVSAMRRWRDDEHETEESFQPLPDTARLRPNWVVPGKVLLDAPVIGGVCVATCLWNRWGVVGAGGLAGICTVPLLNWVRLRRWEREHEATVYYERMPLVTGGVEGRYFARRSTPAG